MKTVHVLAWEYDTGGGFDWFFTAEAADKAFSEEKSNCDDPTLKRENWTAARYAVEVTADPTTNAQGVTDEIDGQCLHLFAAAARKYPQ